MQEKVAVETAGSNYVPPAAGSEPLISKGPATEVSEREARPDVAPPTESYTDKGPLTADSWKDKVNKFNKSTGKKPKSDKEETVASARDAVSEETPAENTEEPTTEAVEGAGAGAEEGSATEEGQAATTAPKKHVVVSKFTAVGKEYELPKYLVDAIASPEQEKEVKDLYTKAMGLDHVKQRAQETTDKYTALQGEHNEVVDSISDLSSIYKEAVQTQNPLLLNHFFDKLQIPHQVILQYATALAQFYESDPATQQQQAQALEAHRRAREAGQQNQRLTQGSRQAQVQARTTELDSALARPEIATPVQTFEQKYGPGSFKQELIRNGLYVFQTEKRDLSVAENVNQVMQRFGLTAAPANGTPAAPVPQVPAAGAAPASASPAAGAAPKGPPVIAAQPHNKVPTIPGVNGKSGTSPAKQAPKNLDDLKAIRKKKFGF